MDNLEIFDKNGKALHIAGVMAMSPIIDLSKVNRVEVIDENGRSYVNWKPTNKTSISMQDDGKTLKVFIGKPSFKITTMDEKKVLKEALTEYIKWFSKREAKTDKLIEVSRQSKDVNLAMLLQKELNK